ncbi:metal ABC transporter solute-binding protein, Zn/Mn family [Thalassotalea maritima]|uniref:metal ABC transporter solute-binding protein, Zn/Mn family n=1 Tax=Thalassotalea maritima TaxID=3242416 RepID=UPI003526EF5A
MHTNSKQHNQWGKYLSVTLAACLMLALPARAALNVFACEPEYASLVRELGGELITINSATTAKQDPHFVQARPSLIAKLRRADLLICAGADLEIGWLPMLQMKAGNSAVKVNGSGVLFASDVVENLDVLDRVDASMGDVHAAGNPHVHLDPHRLLQIAKATTEKMQSLDAENADVYQQRFDDFQRRWQQAIARWQQQATPLHGRKVIGYHSSFRYLFDFLAIEQVADLEPKPGLPPTTSHLMSLLSQTKSEDIIAIVYTAYHDDKGANWLASKSAIKALQLPYTVGGNSQSSDLFALMDSHIELLLNAIESRD